MVYSVDKIPPLDLIQQYQQIGSEVSQAVQAVLASGRYIGGTVVQQFEQQFAEYIGVEAAIGCNSGTDALVLGLRALDIGPGDQVITTPFSFVATAAAISAVGATPVFVDIEAETFNLDLNQIEAAITAQTRAILPVHLFGQSLDMTRLMAIAQSHHLAVIEDCAQATGATWQGQKLGSIGHVGCFSFYPTKNLGAAGDGGAVTTQDPEIAVRVRQIKDHGQSTKYCSEELGINSRLDALQAAVLQIKLRYLDRWNAQRRTLAQHYHQGLADHPGIARPEGLAQGEAVWHQYSIRVLQPLFNHPDNGKPGLSNHGNLPNQRDQLQVKLQEQGISTTVYYPVPIHRQPLYQSLGYQPGSLPIVEHVCQEVLSLPMFPELSTAQQDRVIESIQQCLITDSVLLGV
ncbi:MAG: DegT/DnrJ/EryC1/StrS family aminotransferase [Oscillatoriales cyanobacterium RM1_1_9]|nr:DegT/DnrJ/EryC1/StrS family aminotransferase [Oscillatoriales cyanobacterium RM2_1_1]NJO72069.1 DegT/DnrJ/EryC1/StrS family aminotransferase [Oscillatoriales cyanobacterium RM1_1_9]